MAIALNAADWGWFDGMMVQSMVGVAVNVRAVAGIATCLAA
jgi:hypothetical protein